MTDLGNYEAQSELLNALNENVALTSLAKGGFHNRVARKDSAFPRVVYSEINNVPTDYADNKEREATVNFQLSIFTDSQTVSFETQMTKVIDKIMKELEYKKYDSQSLYEEDTKLYHKALRYEKKYI